MEPDRRQEARCGASFELQVLGVEGRAAIRQGDLSLSGLFVELDAECGPPGTIQTLRLRSRDKAITAEVPARVARVVRSDDLLRGTVIGGVGFEFLAYDECIQDAVEKFVQHVARKRIEECSRAQPDTESSGDGMVGGLSLETDWQLRKGERIRVEVPSPEGGRMHLEGEAVRSRRSKSGTFRTRVTLVDPPQAVDRSVGGIREAMSTSPPAGSPLAISSHLAGDLSKVRVSALLTLATVEQMTGILRVTQDDQEGRIYLRGGRVVDVEGNEEQPRTDQLGALCLWDYGVFVLELVPVDRPDRIGRSTTALLIDLARAQDEQQRVA